MFLKLTNPFCGSVTMRTRHRTQRRRKQRGGEDQIVHAISQLKRFALRAKEGQPFKELQFGYNLGRLQEMIDGGKEKMNEYWWTPLEPHVKAKHWDTVLELIEKFRTEKVKKDYDEATVNKV